MPTYDYLCKNCEVIFSVEMSMAEHDRHRVECPHCYSQEVTQQYSTFFAKAGRRVTANRKNEGIRYV